MVRISLRKLTPAGTISTVAGNGVENVQVSKGVAPGPAVPLVLLQNGVPSNTVTAGDSLTGVFLMAFAVDRIDHVEVFVRDLEAAARWYAEVLGLREICRWTPEPIMIGAGDTKLALFRAAPDALPQPEGLHWHRVAWRTDRAGFEAAQKHLSQLGIKFRGPIDHQLALSIYFADPDGHLLEITYYV